MKDFCQAIHILLYDPPLCSPIQFNKSIMYLLGARHRYRNMFIKINKVDACPGRAYILLEETDNKQ